VGAPRVGGDCKIALVPQVSGKNDVRSDLSGDRNTSDVACECRVPEAYGVPCLHNVAHAHAVGIEPHDLFHVKDRTETWKAQYPDGLEYPMLSDFAIYDSDLHDPLLRYPPLLPQKAGRPKQHRRHKSGLELANAKKRCRAPPTCTICGVAGHKSNNKSWHPKT